MREQHEISLDHVVDILRLPVLSMSVPLADAGRDSRAHYVVLSAALVYVVLSHSRPRVACPAFAQIQEEDDQVTHGNDQHTRVCVRA